MAHWRLCALSLAGLYKAKAELRRNAATKTATSGVAPNSGTVALRSPWHLAYATLCKRIFAVPGWSSADFRHSEAAVEPLQCGHRRPTRVSVQEKVGRFAFLGSIGGSL